MVLLLMDTFGLSVVSASIAAVVLVLVAIGAVIWVVKSAPPRTITLTSGPAGSSFERHALAYQKALERRGLTLNVLPSGGSLENLQRLRDASRPVDLGFVQGGLTGGTVPDDLVSLGSIAHHPLWLFYRGETRITLLSQLAGKRIAIGQPGSGTHALATALLQSNGVGRQTATLVETSSSTAASDLLEGRADAVFLMGDTASVQTLRTLMRAPEIRLYDWWQADAYVRRFPYLNRLRLPRGAIDLGKNLPADDVTLIAPTVELVARKNFNSAVSDALLEIAQDVHGRSGLLQRPREFPAPLTQEYALGEHAARYYKSGKTFLNRLIPSFWVASLVNPILVAVVPVLLVMIPALRFLPVVYRLRIHLQIYRCYRPLLQLERDADQQPSPERARELMRQLDEVERLANRLKVPASFGFHFYELRSHIQFVRGKLEAVVR